MNKTCLLLSSSSQSSIERQVSKKVKFHKYHGRTLSGLIKVIKEKLVSFWHEGQENLKGKN